MSDIVGQKKPALTYELLYELLRQEKLKRELRPLEPDFIENLASYIAEKEQQLTNALSSSDVFSLTERDKLHVQLQNIRRIARELHDKRERKIVDMAINRSKLSTDVLDANNLLDAERVFYDQVSVLLQQTRKSGILAALSGRAPIVSYASPTQSIIDAKPVEKEKTPDPLFGDKKAVRFVAPVPSFVGSSLEPYGPFDENQTAVLPTDVAELLVTQGSAVEIDMP